MEKPIKNLHNYYDEFIRNERKFKIRIFGYIFLIVLIGFIILVGGLIWILSLQ